MELSKSEWATHLAEWRRSGETATRYCEARGLKLGSLRYWSGRIRRESVEALDAVFTEPGRPEPARPRFAKVRRRERAPAEVVPASAPLRVHVGDVAIEVPSEFDSAALRRVLEVLRSAGGGR